MREYTVIHRQVSRRTITVLAEDGSEAKRKAQQCDAETISPFTQSDEFSVLLWKDVK